MASRYCQKSSSCQNLFKTRDYLLRCSYNMSSFEYMLFSSTLLLLRSRRKLDKNLLNLKSHKTRWNSDAIKSWGDSIKTIGNMKSSTVLGSVFQIHRIRKPNPEGILEAWWTYFIGKSRNSIIPILFSQSPVLSAVYCYTVAKTPGVWYWFNYKL